MGVNGGINGPITYAQERSLLPEDHQAWGTPITNPYYECLLGMREAAYDQLGLVIPKAYEWTVLSGRYAVLEVDPSSGAGNGSYGISTSQAACIGAVFGAFGAAVATGAACFGGQAVSCFGGAVATVGAAMGAASVCGVDGNTSGDTSGVM